MFLNFSTQFLKPITFIYQIGQLFREPASIDRASCDEFVCNLTASTSISEQCCNYVYRKSTFQMCLSHLQVFIGTTDVQYTPILANLATLLNKHTMSHRRQVTESLDHVNDPSETVDLKHVLTSYSLFIYKKRVSTFLIFEVNESI